MEEQACKILSGLLLESGYLLPDEIEPVVDELYEMGTNADYRVECQFKPYNAEKFLNRRDNKLNVVIRNLFIWDRTHYGDQFWRNICDRIHKIEKEIAADKAIQF